jgi:hypothetical protein
LSRETKLSQVVTIYYALSTGLITGE